MSGHLCPHGAAMGAQGGVVADEIRECEELGEDDAHLLAFYSACDCCDSLMHHNTCGEGYFVMLDGRTLCARCASTEPLEDFDGVTPGRQAA